MSEQGIRPRKCWVYELLIPTETGGKEWFTSTAQTYTQAVEEATWWEDRMKVKAVLVLDVRLREVEP